MAAVFILNSASAVTDQTDDFKDWRGQSYLVREGKRCKKQGRKNTPRLTVPRFIARELIHAELQRRRGFIRLEIELDFRAAGIVAEQLPDA